MKYYEIFPTHTETPRNTTRKIENLYIEFNYYFSTLQKKSHYFWTGVYKVLRFVMFCFCFEPTCFNYILKGYVTGNENKSIIVIVTIITKGTPQLSITKLSWKLRF